MTIIKSQEHLRQLLDDANAKHENDTATASMLPTNVLVDELQNRQRVLLAKAKERLDSEDIVE